jgi:hypothetical protein
VEAAALSTNGEREGAVALRHTVTQDFFFCAREYPKHEMRKEVRKSNQTKELLEGWWLVRAALMHSRRLQLRSKSEYKHFSTLILQHYLRRSLCNIDQCLVTTYLEQWARNLETGGHGPAVVEVYYYISIQHVCSPMQHRWRWWC